MSLKLKELREYNNKSQSEIAKVLNIKQQQDFLKHCGEHFEILTGGRGHSKTKEVIEDMQKEIEKYK